jgi:hypothetical protein
LHVYDIRKIYIAPSTVVNLRNRREKMNTSEEGDEEIPRK